ncbi:MAG: hypothetical protein CL466_11345 [Acidimicrobiaceae bacterium]|nr:hypothetical protein [Acidimicrobiaceae bacterium]
MESDVSTGPAGRAPEGGAVADGPRLPDYGDACVTRLVPALVDGPEVAGGWPSWLPAEVARASRKVLLVLDGLGWHQLWERADLAPTLVGMAGGPITTVAPTTTAAALTSISTGVPPGEHGVVGYRIAVGRGAANHEEVLNALRWSTGDGDVQHRHDPKAFQPYPLFEDQWPPVVTREAFLGSGFTAAHLSDARLVGYRGRRGLVDAVLGCVAAGEPFTYAYWDDVDRTAHEFGLGERYDAELADCDAMVAELLDRLPAGTALVVTADHGQVHVDDRLVDLPPEVTSLVDGQSGEARFRWLHARPGAGTDLRVACGEAFGDLAWVAGVDRVVADGWLGPMVTDVSRRRLGDVALVPREPVAFVDAAEHTSIHLIGRHGGLTDAELDVPAIAALS